MTVRGEVNEAIARAVFGWTLDDKWWRETRDELVYFHNDQHLEAIGVDTYFDPERRADHLALVEDHFVGLGWQYNFTLDRLGLEGEGNQAIAVFKRHRWISDVNQEAAGHGTGAYAKNDAVCTAALAAVKLTEATK